MNRINFKIPHDGTSGLVPAIAQDAATGEILMQAYMDKTALELTLQSGYVHYFSRSKGRIWKKGEQSGHTQKVLEVRADCDFDCILLRVEQAGAACHTGAKSCFFNEILRAGDPNHAAVQTAITHDPSAIYGAVDALFHTLCERKGADPASSYTAKLFAKGENAIGKKIAEEAAELAFALKDNDRTEIIYEAADLLYHALAGLAFRDISPDLVRQELLRRSGTSGIAEKNARVEK